MPLMHTLSAEQARSELTDAARANVPVRLTHRLGEQWDVVLGELTSAGPEAVRVRLTDRSGAPDIPADSLLWLSYKQARYKCRATCRLREVPVEAEAVELVLTPPESMERVDRRAYARSEIPEEAGLGVSFWAGGLDAQIQVEALAVPVWHGQLTSISAGGLQARSGLGSCDQMHPGDAVGLRIDLADGREPIEMDARFRYGRPDGRKVLAGFEFVGLGQGEASSEHLRRILDRVRALGGKG